MIDASLAAFLQEGLGIHLGTRDEHLQPAGARALAVEVEADGRHLVVYLAEVACRRLLPNLQSNGQAAVLFARPTDDRSCQVKGVCVDLREASDADRPLIDAQWEGFLRNLERIGIPRETMRGWARWPALAVRIRATALFDQTPGPQAGAPLS